PMRTLTLVLVAALVGCNGSGVSFFDAMPVRTSGPTGQPGPDARDAGDLLPAETPDGGDGGLDGGDARPDAGDPAPAPDGGPHAGAPPPAPDAASPPAPPPPPPPPPPPAKVTIFPWNSPWNTRIDDDPVDPNSDAYIADMGADDPLTAAWDADG